MTVYVREAHPCDGWELPGNGKLGISVAQHKDYGDRCDAAKMCSSALKMSIPMVVDEFDDRVGNTYSGMPDRLYIVDSSGTVAYKGGRGPFGYQPSQMEQALILLLLEEEQTRNGEKQ